MFKKSLFRKALRQLKKLPFAILLFLLTISLAACDTSSKTANLHEKIKEKGKLVVAISPDYPPFEFKTLKNGKDTIVGADVDLAKAIADELGVTLELSAMTFDNVLASLKTGKADLAISGLSVTAERAKVYDFSAPYYSAENAILVKSSDHAKYQQPADLAKVTVAVQKGSIEEGLAKEQLTEANIVSLTTLSEAINELKSGQVQALVLEKPVANGYLLQHTDLAISELTLTRAQEDAKAIAIPKNNPELKKSIDKVIATWQKEDKYQHALAAAIALATETTP